MGRQWLRAWEFSAGGVTCSGDLRVVFDIRSMTEYQPIAATISIYNLAPGTAKAILAAFGKKVDFAAGYQDNIGKIFSGDIKWVNLGKDNATDTTTTVFAAAMDEPHNTAVVNKSFKAGSTGLDHYNYLLSTMTGMKTGRIPTDDLKKLTYPRSVTMFGMARHYMHSLAQSVGGVAHYDATTPKLHITKPDDKGVGTPLKVNRSTGMIGLPTQTPRGINVRVLLNPQIKINSLIHLDAHSIQGFTPDLTREGQVKIDNSLFQGGFDPAGIYRVVYIEHVGDSRGELWFMELNCVAKSGSGTQSQLRSGTG